MVEYPPVDVLETAETESVIVTEVEPPIPSTWLVDIVESPEHTGQLVNISTRGYVVGQERRLVAGFVVQDGAHHALIRAVGPGLAAFDVAEFLPQPRLRIYNGAGELVREATAWSPLPGWGTAEAFAMGQVARHVGAFPLGVDSLDCSVHLPLEPGTYTAVVDSVTPSGTGEVLVEIYAAPGYQPAGN